MLRWWRVVAPGELGEQGCRMSMVGIKHARRMREVGFVDVRERVFEWPVGGGRAGTREDKAMGEL